MYGGNLLMLVVLLMPPSQRYQIEDHEIHLGKGLVFIPAVSHSFEHHAGENTTCLSCTKMLWKNSLMGSVPFSPCPPLRPISREDLRLGEFL
ncbi:hypothetical protein TNCV_240461 [Trichonephila clavipes]|nr:hypothetical protein TNCV_240461 [Trichonephila clavipes]